MGSSARLVALRRLSTRELQHILARLKGWPIAMDGRHVLVTRILEAERPGAAERLGLPKLGVLDPRCPPLGAVIEREHGGRRIEVLVTADGFVFAGRRFTSLSAIASEVTGHRRNGWRFFGLLDAGEREQP